MDHSLPFMFENPTRWHFHLINSKLFKKFSGNFICMHVSLDDSGGVLLTITWVLSLSSCILALLAILCSCYSLRGRWCFYVVFLAFCHTTTTVIKLTICFYHTGCYSCCGVGGLSILDILNRRAGRWSILDIWKPSTRRREKWRKNLIGFEIATPRMSPTRGNDPYITNVFLSINA